MNKLLHFITVIAMTALFFANSIPAYAAGTTITVNTTDGAININGNCSLPEAVAASNGLVSSKDNCLLGSTTSPNIIKFKITGSGIHTITTTSIPTITYPVLIDGTSQPGYSGTPLIRVDGNNVASSVGLFFYAGSAGSTVKGLMVTRYEQAGIQISTGDVSKHITVVGNYIGTDGTKSLGGTGTGINIRDGSYAQVGGPTAAERNVVAANNTNIGIYGSASTSDHNVIEGNYIGLNASGTAKIAGSNDGILISQSNNKGASNNLVKNNVISGNTYDGIDIASQYNIGNIVQGNYIGTNASGSAAVGNSVGIRVDGGINNVIGGNGTIANRNLISGNFDGIEVFGGTGTMINMNVIGMNAGGTSSIPNTNDGMYLSGVSPKISNNWVAHSPTGFYLTSMAAIASGSINNCVTGNTTTGFNNTTGSSVTFTGNWWGNPSGPSSVGSGTGDHVSANVNYSGFLVNRPAICQVAGKQLLNNPSFELDANSDQKPDNWQYTNFNASTDKRDCTVKKLGNCSLMLLGNNSQKIVSQTILKNGVGGDFFTFSLWNKSANIPVATVYKLNVLFYNNATLLSTQTKTFNTGTHGFQKVSGIFTAPSAFTKVVFKITFKATTGTAWLDSASLTWIH